MDETEEEAIRKAVSADLLSTELAEHIRKELSIDRSIMFTELVILKWLAANQVTLKRMDII